MDSSTSSPPLLTALEAVLLTRAEPVPQSELRALFQEEGHTNAAIRAALGQLQQQWQHRGMVLVETPLGWRFQSQAAFSKYLRPFHAERVHRFSRAAIETLAIIAYKQPVTRGDIEDIRGVAVSANILKSLEEKAWIKEVGHKNVPGRPALFGTTPTFLTDFGLRSLSDLPSV